MPVAADSAPCDARVVGSGLRARVRESGQTLARVVREPDIRRLLLALAGSYVGYWGFTVAVGVWAFQRGGAGLVGVAAFIRLAPSAILGPFTGLIADRYPRARVMVACDLARAGLLVAVAIAIALAAPAGLVLGPLAVVSVAGGVFRPAQAALMPALARTPDELTAANAAAATIESTGIFLGPALGGVLLIFTTPQVVVAAVAGALLSSALLVLRIEAKPEPPARPDRTEHIARQLVAGMRLLVAERGLRVFTGLFAAQTLVAGAANVLVVVVALRLLHRDQSWVGYLEAAGGVGGVLGGMAATGLIGRRRLTGPFALGVLLWGIPLVVLGGFPGAVMALAAWGVMGAGNTLGDVAGFTLLQRAAPEHLLARAFAALDSLLFGCIALGGLIAPGVLAALGDRGGLVAIGLFLPAVTLLLRAQLVHLDVATTVPERELALLTGLPLFAPLPVATLEHLAAALAPATFAAGETIFRQGEEGDRFYVIAEGEVEVDVDGRSAGTLTPGEAFGEIALLRASPRTATVAARTALHAFTLERDEFLAAVTGHTASTAAADDIVAARLARARPAFASL
jgi:MFS family permease